MKVRRRPIHAAIGLSILLTASLVGPVAAAASDVPARWYASGYRPHLVIDAAGHSHVAYAGSDGLHYRTDTSGKWTDVRVGPAAGAVDLDLAIDAGGRAHLAVEVGSPSPGVLYLTNRSGAWRATRLTDGDMFGVAIAVDGEGEAHIAVGSSGAVDYFTNRKGYFTARQITESGTWYPDIAIDADRRVHIAFESQSGATGIHHVTDAGGVWTIDRLSTGVVGADTRPSIAVDPAGDVHVAYARSGTGQGIKYVTNRSGTWTTSPVSGGAAHSPSLGLLGSNPRVAFIAAAGENYGPLRLSGLSSGSWTTSTLATGFLGSPSIAIGPGGGPRVAAEAMGRLVLFDPSTPRWTLARHSTGLDEQPTMVIDASDKLHLAWARTASGPGIYYRTNASGSWVTTRLTWANDTQPSIGVDGAGKVFIAFRRTGATWETSGVFMISNKTGTWKTARVREGSEPEEYGDTDDYCPSLAVDPSDHVQVTMYDTTTPSGPGYLTPTAAHFSNATGAWVRTEIKVHSPLWSYCHPLAVDGSGKAHVAWTDRPLGELVTSVFYSTNASGTWVTTTVATGQALAPAIAVAGGKVYIAFGRGDNYGAVGIDYVTNATGSWVRRSVPAPGPVSGIGGASIARPAITVRAGKLDLVFASNGMYYATNRSGAWVTLMLTSDGADHQVGEGLSMPGLALDSAGRIRFVFSRAEVGIFGLMD